MVVLLRNTSKYPETVPGLPQNYNFELQKTLSTIEKLAAKRIAVQFPDGLLCYAPVIIDTIQSHFKDVDCIILDDVVYGACCVDDQSLQTDLLIHYGHSCLIPVTEMETRTLYVFVEIQIDTDHLHRLILDNFVGTVAVIGTIQFNKAVNKLSRMIREGGRGAVVPQVKPLSPGEVLGCTSPVISGATDVVYIGDGRFHLESAMIRNPKLNFYRYCPFTRKLSREFYDFDKMLSNRKNEIERALAGRVFGVILGSLGRQGNRKIFKNVEQKLLSMGYTVYKIVLDEINDRLLDNFDFVDAFVQVSCPRLSIDWGKGYRKPLLTPFEILGHAGLFDTGEYQMDYYSREGEAPWKN